MSTIAVMVEGYKFNRERTLATLSAIEKESDPRAVLAWRPGPGRAHIGLAAYAHRHHRGAVCQRALVKKPGVSTELWLRFRGGSTPDDDVPAPEIVRRVLAESREHLLATIGGLDDTRLDLVPEGLKDRGWPLRGALDHRLARAPPSRAGTHYVQFVEIDAEREMMSGRGVGLETGGLRKKANHIASRLQSPA